MPQMTWRTTEELLERARRQAASQGRSLNEWVTLVLDAATDPDLAGTEADRIRERLARAGLLASTGPARRRPADARVAEARAAAGRGTALSHVVRDGRQ
jgi:hypothetical protein